MKIQSVIRVLLVFTALSSIPHIHAHTTDAATAAAPALKAPTIKDIPATPTAAPKKQIAPPSAQDLDAILKSVLAQSAQIDNALEELALIGANCQIDTVAKNNFMKSIQELREILENIKSLSFLDAELPIIFALLKINKAIMTHLEQELPKGFEQFQPIPEGALTTKSGPIEPDMQDIMEHMQENDEQLVRVAQASKNIGISTFNKTYRAFDAYIVDPALNHGWLRRIALVSAATAVSVWALYRFTDSNILGLRSLVGFPRISDNAVAQIFNEKYGAEAIEAMTNMEYKAKLRTIADQLKADKPTKWLSNLEESGYAIINNPFTQLVGAGTYFLRPYYSSEVATIWNWFKVKAINLHNKCMGGAYARKKAQTNFQNQIDYKTTFKDLVGLEHVKQELSDLVEYMKDPETFDRTKRTPQKGYLLLGDTRTGKSFSAKALAGELQLALGSTDGKMSFFEIPVEAIMKNGIAYWIEAAKTMAPCVLFVDEIDMLGLQRAGGNKDLLADFLTAMSGLESTSNKQVILVATTNRPENIDKALLQSGRFGKLIRFEYPSLADRATYITRQLSSMGINIKKFNIRKIALESEVKAPHNTSYEDLSCMITNAINIAKRAGEVLAQKHLEQSVRETIYRIEMIHHKDTPESQIDIIATHQAGHALATHLLSQDKKLSYVTIRPIKPLFREETAWSQFDNKKEENKQPNYVYGDIFTYHTHDALNFQSFKEAVNDCKIELAGHVAEHILLGGTCYSYHGEDRENAFAMAAKIVARGINVHHIPNEMECKNKYFNQALALLDQYEKEVTELLTTHQDTLAAIARELKAHKDLTGAQVSAIVEYGSLDTGTVAAAA